MSIAVALDALRQRMEEFPTAPYVMTVGDDGRPHSVVVTVRWDGDELLVAAGRTTRSNVATRPLVVLLWPPAELGGYSLIVDATTLDDGAADEVRVQPTGALLHRRAASGANDCVQVF